MLEIEVIKYNDLLSSRDSPTTDTDDIAIANDAIHGCNSKPTGENKPKQVQKIYLYTIVLLYAAQNIPKLSSKGARNLPWVDVPTMQQVKRVLIKTQKLYKR